MTCDRVFDQVAAFLDGTLDAASREAVIAHLNGCDDCRALFASLGEVAAEDHALTAAILGRTTGPVCESARDRLGDWVDGALDPVEAATLGVHLEHCSECAALGRVLMSLRVELPLLAGAEPDPAFTAAVLARTSRKPRRASLAERWSTAMRGLLERPRIALEGAFVASRMVVLPFGAIHGRAGTSPAYAIAEVRQASGAASAGLEVISRDAWAATKGFVGTSASRIAGAVGRTTGRASDGGSDSSGTNSRDGASSDTSRGTSENDRKPGAAQEK
jgi:anti-sigma factor RsiW